MDKYTGEQIKKALECCAYWHVDNCEKCPFDDECRDNGDFLLQKSLDIINRQEEEKAELQREIASYKSEIERLRKSNEELATESDAGDIDETWIIARAKSEAIKEFADKLKEKGNTSLGDHFVVKWIDDLVKEMVGESK